MEYVLNITGQGDVGSLDFGVDFNFTDFVEEQSDST
jgi:hypothetical protein